MIPVSASSSVNPVQIEADPSQQITSLLASGAPNAIFEAMDIAGTSEELLVHVFLQADADHLDALCATLEDADWKILERALKGWVQQEIADFDATAQSFRSLEEKIDQINEVIEKLAAESGDLVEVLEKQVLQSFNTLFFGGEDSEEQENVPLILRKYTVPIWAELERCVQKLPPLEERDSLFVALLEEYASRGAFQDAKRLLEQIDDSSLKQHGLEVLSLQTLVQTQNLEETMQYEVALEQLDPEEDSASNRLLKEFKELGESEAFQRTLDLSDKTLRNTILGSLLLKHTGLNPQKIGALYERHPQLREAFRETFLDWAQEFIGKEKQRAETESLIRHISILSILSHQLCQQPLMLIGSIPLAPLTCLGLDLEEIACSAAKEASLFLRSQKAEFFLDHFPSLSALLGSIPQKQIKEPLYEQLFALLLQENAFEEAEEIVEKMTDSPTRIRCLAQLSIQLWISAFEERENRDEVREAANRSFQICMQSNCSQKEVLWAGILREKTLGEPIDSTSEEREEFIRWALQTLEPLSPVDGEVQQLIQDLQMFLSPSGLLFKKRREEIEQIKNPLLRENRVLVFWEQLDPSLEDPALFRWLFQEIDRFPDHTQRQSCLKQLQQKVSLLAEGWYQENKQAYQKLKQEIDQRLRAGDGSAPKKQKERVV